MSTASAAMAVRPRGRVGARVLTVVRRNLLIIYMSLEIMLNAANLALVAFSRFTNNPDSQVFVFFVITVAAAEVAVGLAIFIALYRGTPSVNVEEFNLMKG